ncbi:YopX family protein [Bacillus glycinifermentans]|uniref:YopX family protein n=1 Tax=Bacillus glycinifermentans TaxID=1664069 RepID=UPI002DB683DF|nr:YopX family protein [Bacillus glycinifermentans]MEC0497371.1 YopX family protein [Bacillus glycinifermentans]
MREIKFRAWNAPLKKMEYNSLNAIGFDGRVYYGNADITGFFENIMQYTGLKDKNGREIWDGDIRKDGWGRKFKVVYDNDLAAFYGEYINGPSESLADCGPDSEYLGTVFENPELLGAASADKEEL